MFNNHLKKSLSVTGFVILSFCVPAQPMPLARHLFLGIVSPMLGDFLLPLEELPPSLPTTKDFLMV
jgi:hypothetical protein